MDTAIAIRTAVIKDGKLYVQAGAGVVADSSTGAGMERDDEQSTGHDARRCHGSG